MTIPTIPPEVDAAFKRGQDDLDDELRQKCDAAIQAAMLAAAERRRAEFGGAWDESED